MGNRIAQIDGNEAILMRVSFTGDLGYEIYVEQAAQLALYRAILAHGADVALKPVGSRALGCMRIEKGYGSWSREYSPEWYPHESGMARLVKADKPNFLGKAAWLALKDTPPRQLLCNFTIETEHADAWGRRAHPQKRALCRAGHLRRLWFQRGGIHRLRLCERRRHGRR